MIANILLMKENPGLLELSRTLGFSKTLFLNTDFILIEGNNKKDILKAIREAKKKKLIIIVKPETEDLLRFVLERTEADIILGQEVINPIDSVHFRRGGLDQITCKIAVKKNKSIAFSFRNILESKDRSKLLGRMMLNVKLCKKYKVDLFLANFSKSKMEMRGKQELKALERILKF